MKVLKCRRQCIWLALEYAEFLNLLFLTDVTRRGSQSYYLVTQRQLTVVALLSAESGGVGGEMGSSVSTLRSMICFYFASR